MATYKGNIGHLMQHWTLCEVLKTAQKHKTRGLNYIDAHGMAPWATTPTDLQHGFTRVRDNLPGQKSTYENAWHRLASQREAGYPNSAAFVREVWQGAYSMLLCEIDHSTAESIRHWPPTLHGQVTLFEGNWRDRFRCEKGLPSPSDVGLPDDSLTLVSFDPNTCGAKSPQKINPRNPNIYPVDLELALRALRDISGGILIQLCAYNPRSNNPQDEVIASFDAILNPKGFHRRAKVRPLTTRGQPHKKMMSLVYAKNVACAFSDELAELPRRFANGCG